MIDHSEFLPRLAAFHDGALPEHERAAVRQHLDQCAECRARLDEWAVLDSALKSLAIPDPVESGPAAAALQSIESGRRAELSLASRAPGARRWQIWAGAAAAALLLAFGTALWRGAKQGPGGLPETAQAPAKGARPTPTAPKPPAARDETPDVTDRAAVAVEAEAGSAEGQMAANVEPQNTGQPVPPDQSVARDGGRRVDSNALAAASRPIHSEDSGIPQDPDWPARLAFDVDIHYRFYDRIDAAYVELNVIPLFEVDFAPVGYARFDPLSDRWDAANPEPTLLSPEDTYLVSNLRVERATLLALVTNQAPTSDVRFRLAEVTWRLAQITADQDDVRSAISAQTEVLRRNPEIDTQSRARLAYLRGLVR